MFDITGDELFFKNRPVARLNQIDLSFRRALEDALLDYCTADDFESEHAEALKIEYDDGFAAGVKDGEEEASNKFDDDREAIHTKGFEEGRASVLRDLEHAADAKRVESLLQALAVIHDKLLPLHLGFKQEGQFRSRPAKTSEIKSAASSCCAMARMAINIFRAE